MTTETFGQIADAVIAQSSEALLIRAASFAARKHRDQRRKDIPASPYINHCLRVAELVATVGGVSDPEIVAAAILHDTIEDTETTPHELEIAFGARVRGIVEQLTDDKSLAKDVRKRLQIEHAHRLSADAVPIKLADKIANVEDVTDSPPADWSHQQRVEYVDWAEAVVNNCPLANERLLGAFRRAVERARQTLQVRGDPYE